MKNKYLAIVCFDSGLLNLVSEEKALGWHEKDNIAYSPKLTNSLIENLPTEQYDQWCLFNTQTEFSGMTGFVNYGSFTLTSRREDLVTADPSWDKIGIRKQIEHLEQLLEQFWDEMSRINPQNVILDGDRFIFVSKNIDEIEILKRNCR